MSSLRIWRKTAGKTQKQIADGIGENFKTYSNYERGASPIPPEIMAKLRAMGYSGAIDQRQSPVPALTREDVDRTFKELRAYFDARFAWLEIGTKEEDTVITKKTAVKTDGRAPVILPEHVQEAWIILAEAIDKAGAEYRFMDRKALGLLVGLTAEEVARKGFSGNTRARLLARAEGFVQAFVRHSPQ